MDPVSEEGLHQTAHGCSRPIFRWSMVVRGERGRSVIRWSKALALVGVAVVAAVVSYEHVRALAREHGESGWTGCLIPPTMDGLNYASSMAMLDSAHCDTSPRSVFDFRSGARSCRGGSGWLLPAARHLCPHTAGRSAHRGFSRRWRTSNMEPVMAQSPGRCFRFRGALVPGPWCHARARPRAWR
jgi:Protein of unknown function (DUF2637)